MISRYTRPEMGRIWTEEAKLAKWLEVELAALEALARYNYIPRGIPAKVRAKAKFNLNRVKKIESTVQHDVIAFLTKLLIFGRRRVKTFVRLLIRAQIVQNAVVFLISREIPSAGSVCGMMMLIKHAMRNGRKAIIRT